MFNFLAHGSSPSLLGLHYGMKNICRIYFALIMFWRHCHHSWSSVLKLPRTQWKICAVFYTDWSRSISSPSILHLSSGCGVVWSIWDCRHCPRGLVCKQGNHWAIMNNASSVPTRSHLSRSHWPGCLQPCTEQLCNRKHPMHVPATWLKNGPPKVFQKPLLISADYSPVPPYALQYFWNTFGFNMKNSLQPIDKAVEIQGHKCSNQYLFCS